MALDEDLSAALELCESLVRQLRVLEDTAEAARRPLKRVLEAVEEARTELPAMRKRIAWVAQLLPFVDGSDLRDRAYILYLEEECADRGVGRGVQDWHLVQAWCEAVDRVMESEAARKEDKT